MSAKMSNITHVEIAHCALRHRSYIPSETYNFVECKIPGADIGDTSLVVMTRMRKDAAEHLGLKEEHKYYLKFDIERDRQFPLMQNIAVVSADIGDS